MHRSSRHSCWNDLGKAVAACTAFAVMISAAGIRAAEEVASNLDLMDRLTAEVVVELYGKFSSSVDGRAVRLRPAGTSEDYYFTTNVVREQLMRAGVTTLEPLSLPVPPSPRPAAAGATSNAAIAQQGAAPPPPMKFSEPDSSLGEPLTLQYQNVVFDVKYVDSHRAFLVGGKRVERRATVRLMATLMDPAGRVLWVGEAERGHEDEIDYGDVDRIEQGMYQFSRPVVPSSGWRNVVEPVFVTGVIVGLIYLFFSNQSDN